MHGLTSSIAAGDDAKTTAWNTLKGIAGGATIGGTAAAIGYGATKAGSKLLGTGVKACFIAGTAILTVNGLKKIEDIRAGDRVYAKDIESGKQEAKEVLQTFEREVDVLVHLWIGGEEIVTTQTHPFYVEGKGWTEARKLTEEDCVLDSKNEKLRVEGIQIEELREPVKVYNFEVEEYHTYYVGAAEVLVHNDVCGKQISVDNIESEVQRKEPDLYHYTTKEGAEGIKESGLIKPDNRGRVFVTSDKISAKEVNNALMMGEKHDAGAYVVEITLKEQSYHNLTIQGATQENELIYNGAIRDKRNAILNVKENDF